MSNANATVFIVDDDDAVRDSLQLLMDSAGHSTKTCATATEFLNSYHLGIAGCLVLDIRMPGMNGMELQDTLLDRAVNLPIIFLTGHGNVSMSAKAFRTGAVDFLEKPFDENTLLERVQEAIQLDQRWRENADRRYKAGEQLGRLTPREHEVMLMIVTGHSNKEIATQLELSTRTIETHRGHIMDKTGANSLSELVELAIISGAHTVEKDVT